MSNVCAPLEAIPTLTIITFCFRNTRADLVEKKLTRSSVKINAYCMGTRSHLVIAFSLFVLITLMSISTSALKKRGLLVGTAAKAAEPANVKVVPDIAKRVVGKEPMSTGRGFYPPGLTREKVEKYVADHPDTKAEIYSPTTVVRWSGDQLETIPYHIVYRPYLEPAAKALKEAADLSADPAFANYLRLRADALLTDDYFQSDLAWLDLKNPKFDLIFAPYETYNDDLLGVKATYGAAVLIRNEKESN